LTSPEEPTTEEPTGKCDACDGPVYAGAPRPWACSTSCFCELAGIDRHSGY